MKMKIEFSTLFTKINLPMNEFQDILLSVHSPVKIKHSTIH